MALSKYALIRVKAKGSFTNVYEGKYKGHRGRVVVKVVEFTHHTNIDEYEREINALCKARSPKIVHLKEHFIENQRGFIVLENMKMDLLQFLDINILSLRQKKKIFKQICLAVLHLHQLDMAHLDLKLENVFIRTVDDVKLGDFGSCFDGQKDLKTRTVGTFRYIAPEVYHNAPYSPFKADIWSLGILLHTLVTERWPYPDLQGEELNATVRSGSILLDPSIDSIDHEFLPLIKKMLHKDPTRRPAVQEIISSNYLRNTPKKTFFGHLFH